MAAHERQHCVNSIARRWRDWVWRPHGVSSYLFAYGIAATGGGICAPPRICAFSRRARTPTQPRLHRLPPATSGLPAILTLCLCHCLARYHPSLSLICHRSHMARRRAYLHLAASARRRGARGATRSRASRGVTVGRGGRTRRDFDGSLIPRRSPPSAWRSIITLPAATHARTASTVGYVDGGMTVRRGAACQTRYTLPQARRRLAREPLRYTSNRHATPSKDFQNNDKAT